MRVGANSVTSMADLTVKDPLTILDVARLLTVDERTVRRYMSSGVLESITLGPGRRAARRITQAQYRAYLKRREFCSIRSA
ncbi:MAG: hypothetical protein HZC36_14675 [Armatimonadetes bacterium]|nr:hypothetical protein [Armatimonadota bacterium]